MFLFPGSVPIAHGVTFLNVWNCEVLVAQFRALPDGSISSTYAVNNEELQEAAEQALCDVGGAFNVSGFYPCPPELAARAVWSNEEAPAHE